MKVVGWLLNWQMLWGAVLGWMILAGLEMVGEGASHRGPGYVWYEHSGSSEKVPEAQYRRHQYAGGFGLVFVGVTLWCVLARGVAKEEEKRP